jgi:putative endonuclease
MNTCTTKEIGNQGEDKACDYFLKQGYTLLARNFRHGKAEIDLIFQQGTTVVFVEVKSRASRVFQQAELAVSKDQQRRIIYAANAFLSKLNPALDARFDCLGITTGNAPLTVHIADAFNAMQVF